jgi:hypothetical protein
VTVDLLTGEEKGTWKPYPWLPVKKETLHFSFRKSSLAATLLYKRMCELCEASSDEANEGHPHSSR